MLPVAQFLKWISSFLHRRQTSHSKDTMTLESLHFRIRSAILVITSLALIASASKTDVNLIVYIPVLIAHFLYMYLFIKGKTEFFLGVPYLITTFISYMSTLETTDGFYLRILISANGTLAIYIVQGFSPYLTATMAFGFILLQRRYLYQMTNLYEPITDSYRVPASAFDRFMGGWFYSIIVEGICFMLFQIILRKVWRQYQATKQSLEQTLEELKQTNMKLEKTVSELNQLNKQLKMALESQDLFVACVSHELRNPLNALLGSLDLLALDLKSESQKESLKVARICGESLLGHINNLLDVAKINADKLEISELPTKLSTFLEKFWSFMRIGMNKKGLIGHLCVHRNLPLWIKIDEVRLQQIMENLVGNAIKFTTSGSVRVTLSWIHNGLDSRTLDTSCQARSEHLNDTLLSLEEELITEENVDEGMKEIHIRKVKPKKMSRFNDYLSFKHDSSVKEALEKSLIARNAHRDGWFKIEVVDTGCGVTEEAYQKIFQPFTQGDSSITRKYGGTGLGLYIVKNLIEKMGGSVQLNSVKDIGTQFKILLPIKGIEGVETQISRMPSQSFDMMMNDRYRPHQEGSASSQGTIRYALIVDDDAFNQNIMRNYIETLGFEVDIAVNGLQGVQMFEQNSEKYTFIAMDIQMPVMDGITACKKIRQIEHKQSKQKIPIIIVTGNCSEAEQKACLEDSQIGANYFFRKPFRFSDCKICVQKIMLKLGLNLKDQDVSHLKSL